MIDTGILTGEWGQKSEVIRWWWLAKVRIVSKIDLYNENYFGGPSAGISNMYFCSSWLWKKEKGFFSRRRMTWNTGKFARILQTQHKGDRKSGFNGSPNVGLYTSPHAHKTRSYFFFIYIGGIFDFKPLYNTAFGLDRKYGI